MKIFFFLQIIIIFCLPVFAYKPSQINSRNFLYSNESNLSAWKPFNNFKIDKKANFKTIEALKKFRRIRKLKPYFNAAKGYAIFPNISKAGFGIGGARGNGEVFENGKVVGSTTLTQLSIGLQLGVQAFSQIIFFQNERDLKRFTDGNFEFGASASAALITEGANASADYSNGVAVMTFAKGGLMYEASIGGQKFTFSNY